MQLFEANKLTIVDYQLILEVIFMSICKKCGSQMPNEAKFCNNCGERLENNDLSSINVSENSQTDTYIEDTTIQDMFLKTTGRLNRLRFLKRNIVVVLVAFIVFLLGAASLNPYDFNTFIKITSIPLMPFIYCLNVRRLQDMNYDNKLAIVLLVIQGIQISEMDTIRYTSSLLGSVTSVISMIGGLFLLFKDGTHGKNNYGADPLNR